MATIAEAPARPIPSLAVRWYVLVVMCVVYAIGIADRYVVSTVLDPIRQELRLTDSGVALLTGAPLALFYVTFGIPISWLADRSNRRNILAASLVAWSASWAASRGSRGGAANSDSTIGMRWNSFSKGFLIERAAGAVHAGSSPPG